MAGSFTTAITSLTTLTEYPSTVSAANSRSRSFSPACGKITAGGGVKRGITYGATDEFGFKAIEKPVHVHDLHATILHLLGLNHTKLTYRYSGRDFRLTDVF